MPAENMKPLPEEYLKKLNEFIEREHARLLTYAVFIIKDKELGAELLNDLIVSLYEGKRTLNFSRSPLVYCHYVLRSIREHQARDRQVAFENGKQVLMKNGKTTVTNIRDEFEKAYGLIHEDYSLKQLEKKEIWHRYDRFKATLNQCDQYILDRLDNNINLNGIYEGLSRIPTEDDNTFASYEAFRSHVRRLLQKVTRKVSVHSQAD